MQQSLDPVTASGYATTSVSLQCSWWKMLVSKSAQSQDWRFS